jgi:hypothetical protein
VLSHIDAFIYVNNDYNLMGLFSIFKKKKKDTKKIEDNTTKGYDEREKNSEKEPISK